MIAVKRVYAEPAAEDGERILIDRLWPRGLTKERAKVDLWLKEIAPSDELRKWFHHDVADWEEFKRRYCEELAGNGEVLERLRTIVRERKVTLLYGAKDEEHNQAVVLRAFLEGKG